jgi:hypothetical protein
MDFDAMGSCCFESWSIWSVFGLLKVLRVVHLPRFVTACHCVRSM